MPDLRIGGADFGALAAQILEDGSGLRFSARGMSMSPFIRDGDVVEVQPIGAAAIRCGDVVLYRNGGDHVIVHRVVQLDREDGHTMLVTRGDALACADGPICREQVLGRVVALERKERHIQVNTGLPRILGRLWIGLAPLSQRLYGVLAALKTRLRRSRPVQMN
jgi:signal peptidase I